MMMPMTIIIIGTITTMVMTGMPIMPAIMIRCRKASIFDRFCAWIMAFGHRGRLEGF